MVKDRVAKNKMPLEEEYPLTELPRSGAKQLIAGAVEAEFGELPSQYVGHVDEQGRRVLVRNG